MARSARALPALEDGLHAVFALERAGHLAAGSRLSDGRRRYGRLSHRRHHRTSSSGCARSAKRGAQQIGHSRGGASTKIHAVVDAVGRPVCLALTEGQRHEMTVAPLLLAGIRRAYVIGDRGYDANSLREQLRRQRCRVVIPSTTSRRRKRPFNRRLYKRRHRVENFFQRIKRFRRISTRYDKLAANFFAMVCLAAALTWLL